MSKQAALSMLTGTPAPTAAGASTSQPEGQVLAGSPGLQATPDQVKSEPSGSGDPLVSTRFAQISKKEAELVKQREVFKAEQAQFQTERQKLADMSKKWEDLESTRSKDPLAAMKLAGFTDTDLINFLAAHDDTRSESEKAAETVKSEIQKFKDEQAAEVARLKAVQDAETLRVFRDEISTVIKSAADKYEFCNHYGAVAEDLIYETVAAVLESDKIVISTEEAAQMVEEYYEEEAKSISTLKKLRPAQVQTQQETFKEEALRPEVSGRPASRTLTSRISATSASLIPRKETASEKRQRLIKTLGSYDKS